MNLFTCSCKINNIFTLHLPILHINRRTTRFSIRFSSESTHRLKLAESLQSETLELLEWPALCQQLSSFTSTSMGFDAAESARIPVGRTPDESRKLLSQTSAAVAVPRPLDFTGIQDVSSIVDASVAGGILSIGELCAVKRTLAAARFLLQQLEEIASQGDFSERYSPLKEILHSCDYLVELEQKIEFCIDCSFSVILDRASEDLEIIRSERKRNMDNLESLLKKISTRVFQGGGFDRPLVTERRSRMCVAISASHRSLLPNAVILGKSSSGSTYFMEPKEAVELNNMEVKLSSSERVEEQTILSLLTSEIAESNMKIKRLLDKIVEIDLAFARAAHAQWTGGVCPALSSRDCNISQPECLSINVEGIQHPLLLESSLRNLSTNAPPRLPGLDQGNGVMNFETKPHAHFPVPIDIKIGHGTKVVVISGPNTGGKTASMKTLGLASMMLKAGMYLPAQNQPRLPWFDLILADIGDQQSLEQSLSTFSGHISRLCEILEVASRESLVLIDEIGSGTDPSEGVALSESILQYLKDRVNLAVVTTHYADLTRLKEKDSRFETAATEFSLETLQPTYRILWGSMGESNALNIAKSMGFDERIIEQAVLWVNKLTPDKQQEQKGLLYRSLLEERDGLESQAMEAASLHSDIMNIYNEINNETQDLDEREGALKSRQTHEIQQEVNTVKNEIQTIVQRFESQLRNASADDINTLVKKAEAAIASIIEAHQPSKDSLVREIGQSLYTPQVGEQVYVKAFGNKLATVVEEPGDDDNILVQYGKIRVRVDRRSIRPIPPDASSSAAHLKTQVCKLNWVLSSLFFV
ncbi:putative allantoinase 1-like [Capsicum annuum]|nr:putative allantoinase 1-like [Capsicum annuum]KAF3653526.1 putative allantoinase 1-like [Capsicum annuum]